MSDDDALVPDVKDDDRIRNTRAFQRQRTAWTMYVAGATEEQIQDRLGYATLAACRAALSREARKHMGYREHEIRALRDLELRRLDQLQLAVWGLATGSEDDEGRPSLPHLDRALKIMDQRAKLLGLNEAPAGEGGQSITNNVLVIGESGGYVDDLKRAAGQLGVSVGGDAAQLEPHTP